jgi:two-component system LytT family response regulator
MDGQRSDEQRAQGQAHGELRVLIVDDEPEPRWVLRELLARENVEVVGEAGDGESAVAAIRELCPDLVLLDIQMPTLDGFGVIEALGPDQMPPVIFVTAFDQHAIRAFEIQALDYLLKPVDPARFAAAFARSRAALEAPAPGLVLSLRRLLQHHQETSYRRYFIVHSGDRLVVVDVQGVDYLAAEGNYLRLHERSRSLLYRATLGAVERELDPTLFCRVQRGALLNLASVAWLERGFGGAMVARLHDDRRVVVQKRYVPALLGAFDRPALRRRSGKPAAPSAG